MCACADGNKTNVYFLYCSPDLEGGGDGAVYILGGT